MTDPERIARLEEKVGALDVAIREIKEEQNGARGLREEANITMAEIKSSLTAILDRLERGKEGRYKLTDVILALGMIALGIMSYLK